MSWLQVTITANINQVPVVTEVLESLAALAITYTDAAAEPLLELAPNTEQLWQSNHVTALFAETADVAIMSTVLTANLPADVMATLRIDMLEDQLWERVWLKDFTPRCFGSRLWVCAAGQRPESQDAVIVNLDPGLAFGTGGHPTTAMCLNWLDGLDMQGLYVLDYGCGSGILAIAALCLGAYAATAVDYDPQALEATSTNAIRNGVADRLLVVSPESCPQDLYDCVLANIVAKTLITLAPKLAQLTRPGRHIVLAGILEQQTAIVVNAYQEFFILKPPMLDKEWVLLTGIRRDC